MAPKPLTADMFARAVIASASTYGDDPERALSAIRGPLKRSLTPAAAAVADLTGRGMQPVAALLGLRGNNFSRSRGLPGYEAAYRAAVDAVKSEIVSIPGAPEPEPAREPDLPVISAGAGVRVTPLPDEAAPVHRAKPRVLTKLAAMKLVLAELAKGEPMTGPDLMEALNLGEGQVRVALEELSEEREVCHTAATAEGWRAMFWRLPE